MPQRHGVINHDDTTAKKWKEVKTPTAPKAKDKRGNSIVAAEGGLPPMCLADDHVHDPDDEDKKTIKHKSEKSNPVENRSPDMQPESDKKDKMPAEQQRLSELHNAMEYMVKDKDPDMQMIVQTMLDMVNTVKANKSNPAAPSSRTTPEAAAPDDIKMEKEEATDPGVMKGVTKVSVDEASDEESDDHAY